MAAQGQGIAKGMLQSFYSQFVIFILVEFLKLFILANFDPIFTLA
jgi:hypothetical protein